MDFGLCSFFPGVVASGGLLIQSHSRSACRSACMSIGPGMSTIGFGTVVPNTAFTNALVIAEFWIAVLMGATAGGLLFSRVSTASPLERADSARWRGVGSFR